MTELEEIYDSLDILIRKMQMEQLLRCAKSGGMSVETFLGLEREEDYTFRMGQLIAAKFAIEHILGR